MSVKQDNPTVKREELVQRVVESLLADFVKPLGDGISKNDFLAIYHPQIEWYDHAFHVHRIGHEAVLGLKVAWCHCNQPFRSELRVRSITNQSPRAFR